MFLVRLATCSLLLLSCLALRGQQENSSAAPTRPGLSYFALGDVTLLDGPFRHAQELDEKYLLALDPDRLLAGFRVEAGLEPKATKNPNWESSGLYGHTLGHYLTALAQMSAVTGDVELTRRAVEVLEGSSHALELALALRQWGEQSGRGDVWRRCLRVAQDIGAHDIADRAEVAIGSTTPLSSVAHLTPS